MSLGNYGFRSVLAFFVGGGCKPIFRGDYAGPRSMLAYWLGGANFHYLPRPPEPPIPPFVPGSEMGGGLPYAKHHLKRPRVILDDEEILEFIRIWTLWNDNE